MSKHTYRTKNVNGIDREKLYQEAMTGKKICIGIDVGKKEMFARVVNEEQKPLVMVKWNHPEQMAEFLAFAKGFPNEVVEVAMEPSGTYGDVLRYKILNAGIPVFRVSPKCCHDAREFFDGVPSSHDAKSAAIIAKLHFEGRSCPWPEESENKRQLSAAIAVMDIFGRQFHNYINLLESRLMKYWPEVTQYLSLDTVTLWVLLEEYGSPELVAQNISEARELMKKTGGRLLDVKKIDAVLESAFHTSGIRMITWEQTELKRLASEIHRSYREMREAQKGVEELTEGDEMMNRIGKVIGKRTAAVLVCHGGDPRDFTSVSAYLKCLGLNMKEISSGLHKGNSKITKRGSSVARRYLYFATLRIIQSDPYFSAWFQRKVARDGGKKMKGVIALMRKLVKGLWHVARGASFNSSLLFDAKRLGLPSC